MISEAQRHNMRLAVARLRFPGPTYRDVLSWLHEELRPASYVEIGVFRGDTLRLAHPPTVVLGIDPVMLPQAAEGWRTQTHLQQLTSNEFFAKHSLSQFWEVNRFDLAFVDGLHQFEQALQDILHLEQYAGPESVVAVHDTIPLDEESARPDQATTFHTGDVWKLVPVLKQFRPRLEVTTVWTGPSGLTLIRGFGRDRTGPPVGAQEVERFKYLPWEYYQQHHQEFLETIRNERDAVRSWLRK